MPLNTSSKGCSCLCYCVVGIVYIGKTCVEFFWFRRTITRKTGYAEWGGDQATVRKLLGSVYNVETRDLVGAAEGVCGWTYPDESTGTVILWFAKLISWQAMYSARRVSNIFSRWTCEEHSEEAMLKSEDWESVRGIFAMRKQIYLLHLCSIDKWNTVNRFPDI